MKASELKTVEASSLKFSPGLLSYGPTTGDWVAFDATGTVIMIAKGKGKGTRYCQNLLLGNAIAGGLAVRRLA